DVCGLCELVDRAEPGDDALEYAAVRGTLARWRRVHLSFDDRPDRLLEELTYEMAFAVRRLGAGEHLAEVIVSSLAHQSPVSSQASRLSFVVLVADERFVDVGSGLQCGVEAASESRERLPVGAGVGTARVVDPRLHTLEVARSAAALFAEVDGHAEILPRWRSAVNAMLGHQRRRVSATLERHEAEAERTGRRRAPTCSGGAQGPAHGSESHHGRRLPLLAIGRRGRREAARDRAARAGRVRRRAPSLGLAQR